MRTMPMILALLLAASAAQAQTYRQELNALTRGLPLPVRDFIDRRANCNHWMGEEGYDPARRAQINDAYDRLRCAALGADEAALKRRYVGNLLVLRALDRSRGWLAG